MGLDGAWSFHPYLAARLATHGFDPEQRPPRRRGWQRRRRDRTGAGPGGPRRDDGVAFLRAVASAILLLAR